MARLIRHFHDAVQDFTAPPDAHWQVLIPAEAIALTHSTAHPMRGDVAAHPGWISPRERPAVGGHRVLFHNGGTGGYRSLVAIAPDHQAAVLVLSANARSVDRAGLQLLRRLVTTDRRA